MHSSHLLPPWPFFPYIARSIYLMPHTSIDLCGKERVSERAPMRGRREGDSVQVALSQLDGRGRPLGLYEAR